MVRLPLIAASTLLAAVALVVPAHADPPIYPPSYGSSGVYAVGAQFRDGLTASIPPGHYRVEEAPGIFKAPGFWLRCNDIPCATTYPAHIISSGTTDNPVMEILPSDAAVYLFNTTLTFAG